MAMIRSISTVLIFWAMALHFLACSQIYGPNPRYEPGPYGPDFIDTTTTIRDVEMYLDRDISHKGDTFYLTFNLINNKVRRRVVDIYLSDYQIFTKDIHRFHLLKSVFIDTLADPESHIKRLPLVLPLTSNVYKNGKNNAFIHLVTKNNVFKLTTLSAPMVIYPQTELYISSIESAEVFKFYRNSAIIVFGGNFTRNDTYTLQFEPIDRRDGLFGPPRVYTSPGYFLNDNKLLSVVPPSSDYIPYNVRLKTTGKNSVNNFRINVSQGMAIGSGRFPYISGILSSDGDKQYYKNTLITLIGINFDRIRSNFVNFYLEDMNGTLTLAHLLLAKNIDGSHISFRIPATLTGALYRIKVSNWEYGESVIDQPLNVQNTYSPTGSTRIFKGRDSLFYDLSTGILEGLGRNLSTKTPNVMYFNQMRYSAPVTLLSVDRTTEIQRYSVKVPAGLDLTAPVSLFIQSHEFGNSNTLQLPRLY